LPELALTGYPPEDLLLRERFLSRARESLEALARTVVEGIAVVGFPEYDGEVFNAAGVLARGRVQEVYRKRFLPNYGVFDEMRYFAAGAEPLVIEAYGARIGLAVCEDIWYPAPLSAEMAAASVDLLVCPAASPFHRGKGDWRERMLATRARDIQCTVAFCNLVGGQDELVFDGRSVVVGADGQVLARAPEFEEQLAVAEVDSEDGRRRRRREPRGRRLDAAPAARRAAVAAGPLGNGGPPPTARPSAPLGEEAVLWAAIRCGIRDYLAKNGISDVLLGLSGGIDSALTAALAVDALGADHVAGVAMPSDFSSPQSLADAQALAESLAIRLIELPIAGPVDAFEDVLAREFEGTARGVAEENVQARVRGTLLMALSNKFGGLVLATGNKSEAAVGYATLYGDMAGGLSPIKDLPKTWVYRLARWRNASEGREVIPVATIERPPTAELRPDQRDTDSLPPYEVLDPILEAYVEEGLPVDEVARRTGVDPDTVGDIIRMVHRAEYKRRQGAIGIKLTPRAFGRDRRMPITNRDAP
jgi:NAD+ synthase (glutamine-hydrolysing)